MKSAQSGRRWACFSVPVVVALVLGLACWFRPTVLLAQGTSNATLYGTVTDSSGAAMPQVKVTATNTGTGLASSAVSGPNGGYVIPGLAAGVYEVVVTRAGFATFIARNVILLVAQTTRVDAVMKPGEVTQQVTVTAGAPLVDTQSAGLKGTVERQFIDQLPLINRDAHLLEHIQAGTGYGANGTLTVDGVRGGHNEYELNGLSIDDPAFTQFVVDPAFPTPDAIQEFTLITNGYSAQYGRSEGGQVLVETRSGTNQFHGSAFDYLRNQALNARPFFARGTTPYKRNIFGGTVGGPIRKNKVFFFGSYQGTRTRSTPNAGVQNIVPTQAERSGDFSALGVPLIDPATGRPFSGNKIPSTNLNSITQNLLGALVPLPNGPNGELIFAPADQTNADQAIAKVDAVLSSKDRLTGTCFLNRTNSDFNQGLPKVFQRQDEHDQVMSVDEMHTFTPEIFNDVTLGWLKYGYLQGPDIPGNPTLATFGAKYFIPPTQPQQLSVHVDGDLGIETGGPLLWPRQFLQVKDEIHWVKGKHSFAIGGGAQWGRFWNTTNFVAAGRFIFRSTFTGNDFGDFMLGTPTTFLQNSGAYMPQLGQDYDLYAQDTWRVSRDLTLNLGIRYAPTFYEKLLSKENSNFIPGEQSRVFPNAPPGLVYQGDAGVNAYYHNPAWDVIEPRVGYAWAPFGSPKWAIRTAFGVFHEPMMIFSADNNLSPPYGLQVFLPGPPSFANPYQGGVDPFPFTQVLPTSPASERSSITFTNDFPITLGDFFPQDFKVPTDLQWNFTIQRQLAQNDGLEVAYAGSRNYREPFIQDATPPHVHPGQLDRKKH